MPTKTAIRREQDKQRKHRVNVFLVIAGIIVALAVGAGQIWYAHQTVMTNRPNVSVQALVQEQFGPNKKMVLVAQVKNFGNIEARDVTARSSLIPDLVETDEEAYQLLPIVNDPTPETKLTLAPGEGVEQLLVSRNALRPEDFELIRNGKAKVYFFSHINYADPAGNKHGREACQFFDPHTSRMTVCQTHNSSF